MHKLVEDYLKKMAKKIRNKQARESSVEEIRNHLLDQIDELSEKGMDDESSIATVITNATDPVVLGKKLNLAHKPLMLRYPLTFFFSSSVVIGVVSLIIASHVAIKNVKEVMANDLIDEKIYADFFQDLEEIKEKNIYVVSRNRNIASFLNQHLDMYEQNNNKFNPRLFCNKDSACSKSRLSKKLSKELSIFEREGIAISWVDKILEYDHWNFHADKIVSSHLEQARGKSGVRKIEIFSSYKFPRMDFLGKLVFLRSYQLIKEGRYKLAESLVDHSVTLFLSTNTLVGGNYASYVLIEKKDMMERYKIKNWQVVDIELAKLYKRLSWGWAGVFGDMFQSKKYHERLATYLKPEFGACMGMVERVGGVKVNDDFFGHKFFLEPASPVAMHSMQEVTGKLVDACDLPQLKPLLSENLENDIFVNYMDVFYNTGEKGFFNFIPLNPAKIPFVRRIVGAYLHAVAIPKYTAPYTLDKWKRSPSNI